jgi:single-strand DNA-binding protein
MYSKTIIIGNLGTDPEMRYMPDGTAVTNFSVATNRRWTGGDGEPAEETTWYRVSVWGKMAEPCNQYLAKGRQVFVEGRLRTDPATGGPKLWTAQDGTVRASFELQAFTVQFLGQKGEGDGSGPTAGGYPVEEDEIPF